MPIAPVAAGHHLWPSGLYSTPALLDVSDEWVVAAFGQQLMEGVDEHSGAFVIAAGVLPSGECVEAVKYEEDILGAPTFELRISAKSTQDGVLKEFCQVTGLPPDKLILTRERSP